MKIFELIAELNGFDSNMNVYIEKNPSGAAEINGIQVRNLNKPVGKSGRRGIRWYPTSNHKCKNRELIIF